MKRYIDITAIEEEMNRYIENFAKLGMVVDGNECFYKINELIADAPDADVVEVVYCKDCKHRNEPSCQIVTSMYGIGDYDYCPYGDKE